MHLHLLLILAAGQSGAGFPRPHPGGSVEAGLIAGAAFVLVAAVVVALTAMSRGRETRHRN